MNRGKRLPLHELRVPGTRAQTQDCALPGIPRASQAYLWACRLPLFISLMAHSVFFMGATGSGIGPDNSRNVPAVNITWQQPGADVPPITRLGPKLRVRSPAEQYVAAPQPDGISPSDGMIHALQAENAGTVTPRLEGEDAESMLRYQDMIKQRLESFRQYPVQAWRSRVEGDVVLRFVLGADGACSDIVVVRSSGRHLLDMAAVETVRRAAPFPPPPQREAERIIMQVALLFKLD